ncbi:MAG TPA: hypothetical protein VGM94_07625 [Galbitalea sp.]|jgi:hypothetical protein
MKVTIEKKTDQLNYEDFLGGVTRIVTIADVKTGTKEQQYDLLIEGDSRFWRPPPTVLKLMVAAWGDDATVWRGRSAELYGDPDITFGREKVGGIRVSRLSHIDKPVSANLTETRGKRKMHTVEPLPTISRPEAAPAQAQQSSPPSKLGAGVSLDPETERAIADLRQEWKTKDTTNERKAEIEAEVAKLQGGAS